MPKAAKRRASHEQSVRLPRRTFAVQENAVEHVEIGQKKEATGAEILSELADEGDLQKPMKKKQKQAMKHELFLQRLESSRSPYSKSHERRLKRKAKEQVAGGLSDIQAALPTLDDQIPDSVKDAAAQGNDDIAGNTSRPEPKVGQIGEGKKEPLSKSQRKRALKMERLRIPMILSNPEFASNPFQTIRTHAQNTLVKHKTPA
ncbi:hypothetical protein K474DRAFT_293568 [Panus rudis PR-1116 ss-1]|nr:hypothetical protein K474DRAFT_293568 [Panus rudis PR-1116 ss-1]